MNAHETRAGDHGKSEGSPFFQRVLSLQAVPLFLIIVLGIAAYSNTFHVPFQFDDEEFIVRNEVITNLDNFFSSTRGYEYNPRRFMAYLTFALNYRFGGYEVTGYHAVNLAIHLINALLVYALVLLTFRAAAPLHASRCALHDSPFTLLDPRSPTGIALFSALLFVAHPVQTQAVTYIYQRLTSLATMFYLLSVVMYGKARLAWPDPKAGVPAGGKLTSLGWYLASAGCALCAMKTKEIAFTLPIIIVLYEFVFFRTAIKKKVLMVLPILLTLAIIPISMVGMNRPLGEILSDLGEKARLQTTMPRWDYLVTQLRVITTYIRLIFLPIDQNLDYDYPIYHSLFDPPVFFSFLFLSALAGTGGYFLYKTRSQAACSAGPSNGLVAAYPSRLAAFGIFWFFITLAVESSIIPIVDVIFEHRTYLPSVGAFLAITAAAYGIAGKLRERWPWIDGAVAAVFGVAIIAFAAAGLSRNAVWQDQVRLHQDVVSKSPNKARAHANLASAYGNAGMIDQAMHELRTAVQLAPEDAQVHNNLGIVYDERGLIDAAIAEYQTAIKLRPAFDDAHYNLGVAYGKQGLATQAIEEYRTTLSLRPNNAAAHNNLGSAYGARGMLDEAIGEFQAAIALQPAYSEAHYNLGLIYSRQGFTARAMEEFGIAERYRLANRVAGHQAGKWLSR